LNKYIYPGSFDPITKGHEDIIKRVSKTFKNDKIIIVIANNRDKSHQFNIEQRYKMVQIAIKKLNLSNVEIISFEGVVSNYINENNINGVIRGLRNGINLDYEKAIETFTSNSTDAETIYFSSSVEYSHISSSQVRNFMKFGYSKKIKFLVSKQIFKYIKKSLKD